MYNSAKYHNYVFLQINQGRYGMWNNLYNFYTEIDYNLSTHKQIGHVEIVDFKIELLKVVTGL